MSTVDFHSPLTSPPPSDHSHSVEGDTSPLSDEVGVAGTSTAFASASHCRRRRRKRIAIELPPNQATKLSKDELKRVKNRIAGPRIRERTHKQVKELQATVEQLRRENQQQQAVIDHLRSIIHASLTGNATEPSGLIQPFPWTPDSPDLNTTFSLRDSSMDTEYEAILAELRELFPSNQTPRASSHGV